MTSRNNPNSLPWPSDARFQQLVEMAPDGIVIHDGNRIALANAAAVRLAGATHRMQLVGQPIERFFDPPYLKPAQLQLTDFPGHTVQESPVRDTLHRIDGTDLDVEVRAVAFMDTGRPAAHLIIRDITERLATERAASALTDQLQQAQRMESIGALAGGVAHEVNNMMQVVLGFSNFLLGDARIPDDRLSDVRDIVRAAERAATVTGQLLAYSRRAVHQSQEVDMAELLHKAEPIIRRLLGDDRHLLLASNEHPWAVVDPEQLLQVLVNLTLNARDAMPNGGTLTIAVAETAIGDGVMSVGGKEIPRGRYATLQVRDNGSGIEPAIQEAIFEPFFSTKPTGSGTGLGLAAVIGVLEQNHGYVTLASMPEQGATFTLYLPILTTVGASAAPLRFSGNVPAIAVGGEATILVVDDERAVCMVTARLLEKSGFRVIQASSAQDAFELLERLGLPDLVLTDLIMPGVGGATMAAQLREYWPGVHIAFMSGYSATELTRQGMMIADTGLIQKPFSQSTLIAFVRAELARSNGLDATQHDRQRGG